MLSRLGLILDYMLINPDYANYFRYKDPCFLIREDNNFSKNRKVKIPLTNSRITVDKNFATNLPKFRDGLTMGLTYRIVLK